MSRFAWFFAATLLTLCWQLVDGVYVKVPVQLAVSGDEFTSFGTINGDLEENVSIFNMWLNNAFDASSRRRFRLRCQADPVYLMCDIDIAATVVQQIDLG